MQHASVGRLELQLDGLGQDMGKKIVHHTPTQGKIDHHVFEYTTPRAPSNQPLIIVAPVTYAHATNLQYAVPALGSGYGAPGYTQSTSTLALAKRRSLEHKFKAPRGLAINLTCYPARGSTILWGVLGFDTKKSSGFLRGSNFCTTRPAHE